jgi:hypothetical protein
MGTALLVAAAVAGVGSILTYVFLPSRSAAVAAQPDERDAALVLAGDAMLEAA